MEIKVYKTLKEKKKYLMKVTHEISKKGLKCTANCKTMFQHNKNSKLK